VLGIINAQQPDFFGVQEAVPYVVSEIDGALTAYNSIGRGRDANGGGEGSQIFYRNDRWNVDWNNQGTFQLSPTPEVPGSNGWGFQWVRICTWARMINKTTGQAVYVYNTHFPLAPNERNLCATLVASRIASRAFKNEPVILTGDFNACEGEASMNYFLGQGGSPITMKDSYRVLFPSALAGTFHGFGGNAGACKIDYVYTMGESSVLEASIIRDQLLGGYPSDHFVVRGKMRFYAGNSIDCTQRSPYSGTGTSLPGLLEAENYDKGCNNVTYFDKSAGNNGTAFRSDDVDLETCAEGGFNVGWTEDGEWLEYTVNIPTGTFKVDFRVASANTGGGALHLEMNGAALGNPVTFAGTTGWQTWQTVSTGNIQISGGTKRLRLVIDKGGFNLNSITFRQIVVREPFSGTPVALPGKIEAEHYDKGAQGNGFFDLTASNQGGAFRNDAVDVEACLEGGFNVGWTENTEWMEYAVSLAPGKYKAVLRTASANTGSGKAHIKLNGVNATGSITLAPTGGWQTWNSTTSAEFTLSSAANMLQLYVETGGFNLNFIEIVKIPDVVRTPYNNERIALPGTLEVEHFDVGEAGVVYQDGSAGNTGSVFRSTDVDLENCSEGGYNLGWTSNGEWLEYSVQVARTGTYGAAFRVAGQNPGALHLELDGAPLGNSLSIPASGGWQQWITVALNNLPLSAGNHILRISIDQGGFNVNNVRFEEGNIFSFLRRSGKNIVNDQGNYLLKSMNLGNWMVQEGYMFNMTGENNVSYQYQFKKNIEDLVGVARREQFYQEYLDRYYTKQDIDSLARWGFNSVRIPMHYNQLVSLSDPDVFYEEGFARVDQVIAWCKANNMYAILDLHAAPGGQNRGDISDYIETQPSLWESEANRNKTIRLWRKLAERYSSEPAVGGYDLINETMWPIEGNQLLVQLMKDLTTTIRQVDKQHLLFIEGNGYANDFTNLTPPWDANMAYSFHKYWSNNDLSSLNFVFAIRDAHQVPIWLGEFGENSNQWIYDATRLMEQNNIGWAIWPMKKMQSVSGATSFREPTHWSKLVEYWKGKGPKPSALEAETALSELTENIRMNNCTINYGYLKALFDASGSTKPYAIQAVPGTIVAAHYDEGLLGQAYKDATYQTLHVSSGSYTSWNNGWALRNDGVDLQYNTNEAAPVMAWLETGDFTNYTVQVASAGTYQVRARVSGFGGGKMSLQLGSTLLLNANIPSSGSWDVFETFSIGTVQLPAGQQRITLSVVAAGFNLNYLELVPLTNTASADRLPVATQTEMYPNPVMENTAAIALHTKALGGEEMVQVEVVNSMGLVVLKKTMSLENGNFNTLLNLESQASGRYLVHLKSDQRSESVVLIKP
jgi:endonuclease/exonuclease/phosphatase family metal-dependent hydrolase